MRPPHGGGVAPALLRRGRGGLGAGAGRLQTGCREPGGSTARAAANDITSTTAATSIVANVMRPLPGKRRRADRFRACSRTGKTHAAGGLFVDFGYRRTLRSADFVRIRREPRSNSIYRIAKSFYFLAAQRIICRQSRTVVRVCRWLWGRDPWLNARSVSSTA